MDDWGAHLCPLILHSRKTSRFPDQGFYSRTIQTPLFPVVVCVGTSEYQSLILTRWLGLRTLWWSDPLYCLPLPQPGRRALPHAGPGTGEDHRRVDGLPGETVRGCLRVQLDGPAGAQRWTLVPEGTLSVCDNRGAGASERSLLFIELLHSLVQPGSAFYTV